MMKKKLTSLVLALSMTAAAAVSVSANAIAHLTNDPDSYFADCIKIDGDNSWLWNSYYDDSVYYFHGYYDGAVTVYEVDPPYDIIDFSAENNIDEICEKIKSTDSNLYVSQSWNGGIIGVRGDRRISRETAQKLYELICDDITGFYYTFDNYNFSEIAFQNLTGYKFHSSDAPIDDYKQMIEEYLISENINAKVVCDAPASIDVIPNEEITLEEHLALSKNIYDITGLRPYGLSPSIVGMIKENGIEMKSNVKGDANGDSEITIADATAILQALGNPDKYTLSPQGEYNADVYGNGDGITPMDAITIQQYNANLIQAF